MRSNAWFFLLAATLVGAAIPSFAQVTPAATNREIPLVLGAGFSDFNADFGAGRRIAGGAIWADWNLTQMPGIFRGLGVEILARDLSLNDPSLPNMRYDTAEGGILYHVPLRQNLRVYAKALGGFGSIDFPPAPHYAHDSRTPLAVGGGADVHVWNHLWVRVDYEYQIWPDMFRHHALTPNGFTIGPGFDFRTRRSR